MPCWLHIILATVTEICGAVLAYRLTFGEPGAIGSAGLVRTVAGCIAVVAGALIPALLFRYVVPARCSRCGRRTTMRWGNPISYHCPRCGNVQVTLIHRDSS